MAKLTEVQTKAVLARLGVDPKAFVQASIDVWLPNDVEKFAVAGRSTCLVPLWRLVQRAASEGE